MCCVEATSRPITTHRDPKSTVPGRLGFNEVTIAHGNLEHIGIIISLMIPKSVLCRVQGMCENANHDHIVTTANPVVIDSPENSVMIIKPRFCLSLSLLLSIIHDGPKRDTALGDKNNAAQSTSSSPFLHTYPTDWDS